ncbi:MAG: hypothetical protein ACR2MO_17400 [Acidimicrobiales bacterium]
MVTAAAGRSKPRPRSGVVHNLKTYPECRPFKEAYDRLEAAGPTAWPHVEADFVQAMAAFDTLRAAGEVQDGAQRNGRGGFFNDLLALVLENCAGLDTLYKRTLVHGRVFKTHELDVTYPAAGPARFTLEAKVLGTPLHPGNEKSQSNALGRSGSADLDKRLKEAAFKAIDLKAEYDLLVAGQGGASRTGPGHASMTSWLRQQLPSAYVFLAARCVDETDRHRLMLSATAINQVFDHVGVFCFGPVDDSHPTNYKVIPVQPNAYDIGHVLQEACRDLRGIHASLREELLVADPDDPS